MNFFLWIFVWMSCFVKVNLMVFNSFVRSLQKVIIFMSKNERKITFNAFVIKFLIFFKFGFIGGNEDFDGRLFGKELNFLCIDGLKSWVEIVDLSSKVLFIFISIWVIGIENEVWDFPLLLFLTLDFLFENVLEFFVLIFGFEEIIPIGCAWILAKTLS